MIQPEQMQKGFLTVVAAVDDLQIDVPDAPDLVANFVARAVVDDILPPAFVDKLPPGTASPPVARVGTPFTAAGVRHAAEAAAMSSRLPAGRPVHVASVTCGMHVAE